MVLKRQLPSRVQSGANAQPEAVSEAKLTPAAAPVPVEAPAMQVIREDLERAAAMLSMADEQTFTAAPVIPAANPPQPAQPASTPESPAMPRPESTAATPGHFAAAPEVSAAQAPRPAPEAQAANKAGPSRPDNAHVLRRRDTRPRNLNLKPAPAVVVPETEPAAEPTSQSGYNAVPINTTPLSEVDDRLMDAGILSRVVDKLDAGRPAAAAETMSLPISETTGVEPLDFLMPVPQQQPVQASAAPVAPAEIKVADMPTPAFAPAPQEAPEVEKNSGFNVPPPAIFASTESNAAVTSSTHPSFKGPEQAASAPVPAAAPAFAPASATPSASPAAYAEPLPAPAPAPTSDLPWAQVPAATLEAEMPAPTKPDAGWTVPLAAPVNSGLETEQVHPDSAPPPPPLDLFKTLATPDTGATIGAPLPPPLAGYPRAAGNFAPPELPGNRARTGAPMNRPSGSSLPLVAGAAVVVLAVLGAYWWVSRTSGTLPLDEQMAAITGQQKNTSPAITDVNMGDGVSGTILQPPVDMASAGQGTFQPIPPVNGNSIVDFADVPPADVNKPIVADGTEKMPDDLGLVASFQQAVAAEKAKQGALAAQGNSPALTAPAIQPDTAVAVQKEVASDKLKQDLAAELAAYRQALAQADSVAASPKPSEFFADPKAYMGKAPGDAKADGTVTTASTSGDTGILPPPANTGTGLPPSELYTNNPNNLPLIAEPTAEATQKVRTLEDFNVAAFEPETDRVRIPRGLKPRVSLSEFPEVDVLSFVPGKGLIALYQGNEGVLLLGENLEGWELVAVNADNAEFRKGQKTNYVSAE